MEQLYSHQRRFYPYLFGGALWFAWLLSLFLGGNNVDMAGQVVGTDYLMFYTAGQTLADGATEDLYDFVAQSERQQAIIGPALEDFFAYINLPFLAWLYVPFSAVPYVWSFVLWSLLGLLILWLCLKGLGKGDAWPLALTFVPVFSTISFGQNAFLSLGLLTAVYLLWRKDQKVAAGLVLALLVYKPQLVLGVGFLWLLNWRQDWKALVAFWAGEVGLIALTATVMPEALAAYAVLTQETLPVLASLEQFPVWHMHHIRGFWQLLFPSLVADGLWLFGNLMALWLFWRLWRGGNHDVEGVRLEARPFWFAWAILITLWTTPHAMVYDWSLLLIPAVLLWEWDGGFRPLLRRLMIVGWLVYLISGPLTAGQLAILPVAVQISPLFFAWALWSLWQQSQSCSLVR